ncbi:MAG: PIN domain-containing protein [Candidatus Dormibacteraeota bacterium]|nr:PIN domain-containing protein [Candidatus Dormibacteraeota bacterium]
MIAPDSSVTIAAAAPWHVAHEAAVKALAAEQSSLIAHVAYETTAAMSRMPAGQRLAPAVVLEWLERRFRARWLVLPASAARNGLRAAIELGIRGGALHDALIAATAAHHNHTLISADRRAAPVYTAFGVEVIYIVAA